MSTQSLHQSHLYSVNIRKIKSEEALSIVTVTAGVAAKTVSCIQEMQFMDVHLHGQLNELIKDD
jgi:hypothetical protein